MLKVPVFLLRSYQVALAVVDVIVIFAWSFMWQKTTTGMLRYIAFERNAA